MSEYNVTQLRRVCLTFGDSVIKGFSFLQRISRNNETAGTKSGKGKNVNHYFMRISQSSL